MVQTPFPQQVEWFFTHFFAKMSEPWAQEAMT